MRVPAPSRRLPGTQPSDAQVLRRAVGLVAVLFVVGGALLFGSSVFVGGHDSSASAPSPSPSALPSKAVTTSSAPSPTPSPSASPTGKKKSKPPTAAGMESFLRGYLATVADDPATAWQRLTPAFRNASGGFTSYRSFWASVTAATLTDVFADPQDLTVTYGVRYTRSDGRGSTDRARLRLVYDAGRYRIDGEG